MAKFVVDSDTLQFVANALTALSEDFSGIARTTSGLTPQEIGGQSVLRHLEQFDDSWRYGRMIIDDEIVGMSRRLMAAKTVYELIEQKVQEGGRGTIDLGRWGVAHLGAGHGSGGPGSGGHGHRRSGTGTTTIGGGPGHGHRSGTGTTTIGGGSGHGHRSGTGTTTIGGGRTGA